MLWLAILLPLAGGLGCLLLSTPRQQVFLSLGVVILSALLLGAAHWGFLQPPPVLPLIVPELGLALSTHPISMLLAAITLLLWLASLLFSLSYFSQDQDSRRYFLLLGFTCCGLLITFLGDNFLTLLLGFELMSLSSWGLVAHTQTDKAREAGSLYLMLGVLGGMLLFAAMALLYFYSGGVSFTPAGLSQGPALAMVLLLIAGFGIKAGMIPVHLWLPEAHPAAPAPASALLSGILIKTGAYGIMRSLALVHELGTLQRQMGATVLLMGLGTMAFGVFMALLQHDAKRMLAYHSISQMGYILTGLGTAYLLGSHGTGALTGAVFHMVNHSLFKALLFLVAGSVYLQVHQLDLYRLGGLRRVLPWTFAFGLIASLGITGFPGFNGFASKTLLHEGLLEAVAEFPALGWTDFAFTVVSAGTVCSFFKFIILIFLKPAASVQEIIPLQEPGSAKLGMAVLALPIILLGILAAPAAHAFAPATAAFAGDIHHFHPHLWSLHSLQGIALPFALGGIFFWAGMKYGLFHLHLPKWFSLLRVGETLGRGLDTSLSRSEQGWGAFAKFTWRRLVSMEAAGESILEQVDSHPKPSRWGQFVTVINLNFDTLLVVSVLSLLLFLWFPLSRLF